MKIKTATREVYYKGQPFQYKIIEVGGKRHFQLYDDGILRHSVEQADLDVRSNVSFILDSYYSSVPKPCNRSILN